MTVELTDPEDFKLLTLARSTAGRLGAPRAAAIRDSTGRTYAAGEVSLPSLQLSPLQVTVAMAVSSGATELEAGLVIGDDVQAVSAELDVVRELAGAGVSVYCAAADGRVIGVLRT